VRADEIVGISHRRSDPVPGRGAGNRRSVSVQVAQSLPSPPDPAGRCRATVDLGPAQRGPKLVVDVPQNRVNGEGAQNGRNHRRPAEGKDRVGASRVDGGRVSPIRCFECTISNSCSSVFG
jgi:hypothetical protein